MNLSVIQGDGIADKGAGLAGGSQGDEARIVDMVVIHPVRDQDPRSEMAIIVVINELDIGAVTGPATMQVAQPLFLRSDQPELLVAFMWIDATGTSPRQHLHTVSGNWSMSSIRKT